MDTPKVEVTAEHVLAVLNQMAQDPRKGELRSDIAAAQNRAAFDVVLMENQELKARMGDKPLKAVEESDATHG